MSNRLQKHRLSHDSLLESKDKSRDGSKELARPSIEAMQSIPRSNTQMRVEYEGILGRVSLLENIKSLEQEKISE